MKKHYLLNHSKFNNEKVLWRLCQYYDDVVLINCDDGETIPLKLTEEMEKVIGIKVFSWDKVMPNVLKTQVKEDDVSRGINSLKISSIKSSLRGRDGNLHFTYQDLGGMWRRIVFIPIDYSEDEVRTVLAGYLTSKSCELEISEFYTGPIKENKEHILLRFAVEDMYKYVLKINLSNWEMTYLLVNNGEVEEKVRPQRWDQEYNIFMDTIESKNIEELKNLVSPNALVRLPVGEAFRFNFSSMGFTDNGDYGVFSATLRIVYEGDNKVAMIFIVDETAKVKEKMEIEHNINQELHRERQFKKALLADALGYYEVNLSRDMITMYKTHKEDSKAYNPFAFWGMKIPCNYTSFVEKCATEGLFEGVEVFHECFDIDKMFERYEQNKKFMSRMFPMPDAKGIKHIFKVITVLSKEPVSNDLTALIIIKDMSEYIDEEEFHIV